MRTCRRRIGIHLKTKIVCRELLVVTRLSGVFFSCEFCMIYLSKLLYSLF
jgi:hypothetical protein